MISYSERECFRSLDLRLLEVAQRMVAVADHTLGRDGELRCHELARAVGEVLDLEVADGWYGMLQHSWLWTSKPKRLDAEQPNLFFPPDILDVYAPGRLPQVQLVRSSSGLPYEYRRGEPRADVHQDVVAELVRRFRLHPVMVGR